MKNVMVKRTAFAMETFIKEAGLCGFLMVSTIVTTEDMNASMKKKKATFCEVWQSATRVWWYRHDWNATTPVQAESNEFVRDNLAKAK